MIPLLDLTRQNRTLWPQLERAIHRVIRKGNFILGEEVDRFEKGFARFCHVRYGVGVASGSDALELALRAVGVGPGDLVATVSFTFTATADAILQVGARPLFVDIDPNTYTMDPHDLEARLQRLEPPERRRLRAVIPVHLYGHPCPMDEILAVARRYHLSVVEDAAQAAGARWRGRPVGSLGDAGCFSFFPSKNLGTFGDGGMVVTHSKRVAGRIRSLRIHGRGDGLIQERLGRNSRLDELQAAILRVKLEYLRSWVTKRQALARAYTWKLSRLDGLGCPVVAKGAKHAFHLYVIRSRRRDAIEEGLRRRGIASQVYYFLPIHRQPLYRRFLRPPSLPETEQAAKEVLAIPLFPELRRGELNRICQAISSTLCA